MKLSDTINDKRLRSIAEKVELQIPVDNEDARFMLTTDKILDLGAIAHHVRRKLHGDVAHYAVNMNLNYTNVCELRCPLCAFSRDASDADSYTLGLDEIEKRVRNGVAEGIDEVHIVGGLNSSLKLEYFEEMIQLIKSIRNDLYIVAFTATEYVYFARLNNVPIEEVFRRLVAVGVDALPGGGAEIFSPSVRQIIAPKKISGNEWLQTMRTAHQMGLKTNATMLYNHVETTDEIIDHLFAIRELQDETAGFKTFVPLLFHEGNTGIKAKRREPTGFDDIRIYASSRIILHNVPHIKALWMYLGEKMAQVLLNFGVDDIGATYNNEKVVHAAGARTPDYGSEAFLKRMISDAHMTPKRTNAGYSVLETRG